MGETPYADVPNDQLRQHLLEGQRLQRPPIAPVRMYRSPFFALYELSVLFSYKLMCDCWSPDSDLRPSFVDLQDIYERLLSDNVEQYGYLPAIDDEETSSCNE